MSQSDYLNAMGISTWVVQEGESAGLQANQSQGSQEDHMTSDDASGVWTFVIDQLTGDASLLFDKILSSLMLTRQHVQVITSAEALSGKISGQVVVAMGSDLGKKLLQLQEPFEELRGAVLSFEVNADELPVVLSYHPEHLLKKTTDKAKVWQDLTLARSLV